MSKLTFFVAEECQEASRQVLRTGSPLTLLAHAAIIRHVALKLLVSFTPLSPWDNPLIFFSPQEITVKPCSAVCISFHVLKSSEEHWIPLLHGPLRKDIFSAEILQNGGRM